MNMLDKAHVYQALKKELETKISRLQIAFDDLLLALTSNTKSSAGDKHETGRAMAQLEQEKLSSQLGQLTLLKEALAKIEPDEKHESIQFGSLIKTGNGYFFLSIGLGKISLDDLTGLQLLQTFETDMKKMFITKTDGYVLSIKIADLGSYAKNNSSSEVSINTEHWNSGIYIMKAATEVGVISKQIIKN